MTFDVNILLINIMSYEYGVCPSDSLGPVRKLYKMYGLLKHQKNKIWQIAEEMLINHRFPLNNSCVLSIAGFVG